MFNVAERCPIHATLSVRSLVTGNAYRLALLAPAAAGGVAKAIRTGVIKCPRFHHACQTEVETIAGQAKYGIVRTGAMVTLTDTQR